MEYEQSALAIRYNTSRQKDQPATNLHNPKWIASLVFTGCAKNTKNVRKFTLSSLSLCHAAASWHS